MRQLGGHKYIKKFSKITSNIKACLGYNNHAGEKLRSANALRGARRALYAFAYKYGKLCFFYKGVLQMKGITSDQGRQTLEQFKMEAANEVGVNLKNGYNGDLTSRQAGSIGGQMVKKMIDAYKSGNVR